MRLTVFALLYFICLSPVFSQIKIASNVTAGDRPNANWNGAVYAIDPDWNIDPPELIESKSIKNDSVFRLRRHNDRLDSTLAFVEYFDTLGNKLETDEYTGDSSQLWRIRNYSYEDGLLFKMEQISTSLTKVNHSNSVKKSIFTYEYDSAGNNVRETLYDNVNDSAKRITVTKWEKEYDNLGHIVKEYETPPKQESYLKHKYSYRDGKLNEDATFDMKKNWIYSYIYMYNSEDNLLNIFLSTNSSVQRIQKRLYYDTTKRLTKEDIYTDAVDSLDHVTDTFVYNFAGLVVWQSCQDVIDNIYYFVHHYTPAQPFQISLPMDSVDYDKTFTKVEIESEYPGGAQAWQGFLSQTLHYPDIAINQGIQGDVVVLFVVDKEGNISKVRAVSGPQELREEAERVIRKSGKWTPAVQHGRQVKSYKNQPIKFRIN